MNFVCQISTAFFLFVATVSSRTFHLGEGLYATHFPVAQKLTFEIGRGETNCFYETFSPSLVLYTLVKVIEVGRVVGFTLKSPQNILLYSLSYDNEHHYQADTDMEGVYEFCIENANFVWPTTRVDMTIVGYKSDDFDETPPNQKDGAEVTWSPEMQELEQNASNAFYATMTNVILMEIHMRHTNAHEKTDMRILKQQQEYVNKWSLFQSIAIIMSGIAQIFLYRKMFNTSGVTGTGKVRA